MCVYVYIAGDSVKMADRGKMKRITAGGCLSLGPRIIVSVSILWLLLFFGIINYYHQFVGVLSLCPLLFLLLMLLFCFSI